MTENPMPRGTDELLKEAAAVDARVFALLSQLRETGSIPPADPDALLRRVLDDRDERVIVLHEKGMLTRRARWLLPPAAVAAVIALFAALSYAHVMVLPSSVRTAYAAIGIHLPAPHPASAPSPSSSGVPRTAVAPGSGSPAAHENAGVQSTPAVPSVSPSVPRHGDYPGNGGDSKSHSGTHCDVPQPLCGI